MNVLLRTLFSDLELTGNIDIPSKTYEDILAVALINLILSKYNEYFLDEDYRHFGSFEPDTNQQRTTFSPTGKSAKHLNTRGGQRTTTIRTDNFPVCKNAQQMKDKECSELSSLSSTTSSSSSSTSSTSSSTSSFSSSSTEDSISSSSSLELYAKSLKQIFNTVYDGSLGIYLTEKSQESVGDNWILKPEQKFYLFNSIFGFQRLNTKDSFKSYLINLTDDLKEELHSDMEYSNEETDCEYTEKQFASVLHYRSSQPNLVYLRQRFYLKLGEEIGESSTDDMRDEDNILPVFERVQLFESLSDERNPQLSKVTSISI